jgi:hypothetical protein
VRHRRPSRRSLCERWPLGLLLTLLLSASLAACGGAENSGGERPPTRTTRPSNDTLRSSSGGRVSRALSGNFALLRSSPDGIPPLLRRTLKGRIPGMVWELAHRVPVHATSTYWLVPSAKHLCMVATTPTSPAISFACTSAGRALRRGVMNTSLDKISGRRTMVGVTPDGTHSALIQSGALTTSVRVRHGIFVLRDSVALPPDQVTLR